MPVWSDAEMNAVRGGWSSIAREFGRAAEVATGSLVDPLELGRYEAVLVDAFGIFEEEGAR